MVATNSQSNVLDFIYQSLEKTLLSEDFEKSLSLSKNLLNQIDYKEDYKDMLLNIFFVKLLDELLNDNDLPLENFAKIIALLSFGSQSYIIKKLFLELKQKFENTENFEDYDELKEILQKKIFKDIKYAINDIYDVTDPMDVGFYYKFLQGIIYNPDIYIPGNANYLKENEKLSDVYDFSQEYLFLESDEKEKQKLITKNTEQQLAFNPLKNIQSNIVRNNTKLANMIMDGEEINQDTLDYLKQNNKFFNALLHSLYSKFLLKEMVSEDKTNKTKINLFLFIKKLSELNDKLFRESLIKLKQFLEDNNSSYFEELKKELNTYIGLMQFATHSGELIKRIFNIKERGEQKHRIRKINDKDKEIDFDLENNPFKEMVYKFFYERGFWNKTFEKEANNQELIKVFVYYAFEMCQFKEVENEDEMEKIIANLDNHLKTLGAFFKNINKEQQNIFFYTISSYVKQKQLPLLKNLSDKNKNNRTLLVKSCSAFLSNFYVEKTEENMEEWREYEELKEKIISSFQGIFRI